MLKKRGLDTTNASSYRPISNLCVLSKLLELIDVRQLMEYLSLADLLPPLQSGFRQGYSTEIVVLWVLSYIPKAVGSGPSDLSAADYSADNRLLNSVATPAADL